MIRYLPLSPSAVTRLDASNVVWTSDLLAKDEELWEVFKQGADLYPYSFAAFLFGTNAADLRTEEMLETFDKAFLGTFQTDIQVLTAVVKRISWHREGHKEDIRSDDELLIDFLTGRHELLRGRLAERFATVPVPGGLAVFDLDVINIAVN